jgi:hypothetical protein
MAGPAKAGMAIIFAGPSGNKQMEFYGSGEARGKRGRGRGPSRIVLIYFITICGGSFFSFLCGRFSR